jgi:hypothetical protein
MIRAPFCKFDIPIIPINTKMSTNKKKALLPKQEGFLGWWALEV